MGFSSYLVKYFRENYIYANTGRHVKKMVVSKTALLGNSKEIEKRQQTASNLHFWERILRKCWLNLPQDRLAWIQLSRAEQKRK